MDLRLIQRDHPNPWVNDCGLTHRDPYFRACWGPLLDPWTTHVVARVAELTAGGDVTVGFDDFCRALNPEPARAQVRLDTVTSALSGAERSGLGFRVRGGTARRGFCVYRHVALLNEPSLRRLTDPELFAHASAVEDVNQRLQTAGRPLAELPDWLADRLRRGDPTVESAGTAVEASMARLDALQRPGPAPAAPSL